LGVAAVWGIANLAPSTEGDVGEIEQSLRGPGATPTTVVPRPTTAPVTEAAPLWAPNEESALGEGAVLRAEPVRLRIPTLDLDAPVAPYGVDARTGQIDIPDNASEVAWYRFGPAPGDTGSAVLAAHVDLESQGPGVFFRLADLTPGDQIMVEFDDGRNRLFRVEGRTVYPKDSLPLDAIFSRAGSPILTLITCGGGFSASDRSYDSNVVVYAVPVDGMPTPPT
jgi:LPXTG-site transpeptidase (sortase) family protein